MPENKISNFEKLFIFMLFSDRSYEKTSRRTPGKGKYDSKFIVNKEVENFVEKNKNLSEIESWFLPVLKQACDALISRTQEELLAMYSKTFNNFTKFKIFAEKVLPIETEDRFLKYFGGYDSKKTIPISWVLENFNNKLEREIEKRSKHLRNLLTTPGGSFDDTAVDVLHQKRAHKDFVLNQDLKALTKEIGNKILAAKELKEIERLYLTYASTEGCNLINSFLGGHVSLVKSKNSGNRVIEPATFLEILEKALKLKKNLMYAEIDETITVYRGLSLRSLIRSINDTNQKQVLENSIKTLSFGGKPGASQNVNAMYTAKNIVSTSRNQEVAEKLADKAAYNTNNQLSTATNSQRILPIVMKILIIPKTACGKDFQKTKFGTDDYYEEIMLAPEQKIKIAVATKKSNRIYLTCKTCAK